MDNLEMVIEKVKMIETPDVVESLKIAGKEGNKKLVLDVHGFSVKKAKNTINHIIALNNNSFTLEVIHGYVHGTAIKEVVNDTTNTINKRIQKRKTFTSNYGITKLEIAAN